MSGASPLDDDALGSIFDELTEAAPEAPSFFAMTEEPPLYVFGQDQARAPERLAAFERMTEKLARALKDVVEPFARTRVTVAAQAPETTGYGAWTAKVPAFTALALYRMRPHKGCLLLAIEPDFVGTLMESFYGGATAAPARRRAGDFSSSEELLLRRLRERIMAALAGLWEDYAPVEPQLAQTETSIAHLNYVRPDEAMVVQRFRLTCAGGEPATLQFVLPLAMLRPIEARLASKVHDEGDGGSSEAWRLAMGAALSQVTLPVRSVLARPEITVAQLLALQPGDVIPITLAPRTPLLAGSRVIADGVIGEQEGRAALLIEQVGNE